MSVKRVQQQQQQQQQKANHNADFPQCNKQILRTVLSEKKQTSFDEVQIRRSNNPLTPTSSDGSHSVKRTSSTPTINKPVGSNRLFSTFRK